ncbi:GNAT family N-acetyltransferase [Pseudoalteromonas luteoviolacea]|uniref:GNAT family N-acetyltransferase n=1 Tax=Pseudoalteromonas luteoviolacea TaxID=43657 RepID=UPI001B3750FA|nr:GNAT family N-acetyltransferase [Pseudoalteromonas luteoviolacea]MBQ4811348.1 GNAT family N-acetyltransferase [Pseudoalteromonas luteoviolacea]
MIELLQSSPQDVDAFIAMEQQSSTLAHIIPYAREAHLEAMSNAHIIYLSIYAEQKLAGFIILAIDQENSVEFRRIVISDQGKGIGQKAIALMEAYCVENLKRQHVWLDVFEKNTRGIHIYTKLGYRQFDEAVHEGSKLILMEKSLA